MESKPLVPKLRFPEFRGGANWTKAKLEDLVSTITPPVKLQTSEYSAKGKFPIVDQSQEAFCGWTDDVEALVAASLPLVVFGDHTCALKFVQRPFAQGADGIKILHAKPAISPAFLFQSLSHEPLVMEDYKRHFSMLKERAVYFPEINSGEQHKIAECLTSLDELIEAEGRKLMALRAHKKGLMQNLFSCEGEMVPRLRFPEFDDEGVRRAATLEKVVEVASGQVDPTQPPFCDLPHVGGENIESHTGRIWGIRTARELQLISGKYAFGKEDILYSKIRPVLNKVAAPDFEGICSADIYPIRSATDELSRAYLFYVLQSEAFQTYATKHSDRGKIPKINREALLAYRLLIPHLPEQQRIVKCLGFVDALSTVQTNKLDALKLHKQGLMQGLFPSLAHSAERAHRFRRKERTDSTRMRAAIPEQNAHGFALA